MKINRKPKISIIPSAADSRNAGEFDEIAEFLGLTIRAWILVDREVVPVADFMEWAQWYEAASKDGSRIIAKDDIEGIRVSTVFIGLEGDIFETMIFGLEALDIYQERCDTYAEALQQHARGCEVLREWLEEQKT